MKFQQSKLKNERTANQQEKQPLSVATKETKLDMLIQKTHSLGAISPL